MSNPDEIEKRKHASRLPGMPEITGFDHALRRAAGGFDAHLHPGDMELVYIARGELCWWAGDGVFPLRGGDIYLTFPDEPHGSRDNLIAPCELYWFTLECAPRRDLAGLRRHDSDALRQKLLSLPTRHFPASELLKKLFVRLDALFRRVRSEVGAAQRSLLPQTRAWLAATLWEVVECAHTSPAPTLSAQISHLLRWLEDHLQDRITLPQMARRAGLSESFFKERFRAELGMSPGKYYLRRRVSAAAAEIVEGRKSLVEIALDYGFGSSQYLATCLRRETGRTPTQLRSLPAKETGPAL